MKNIFILTKLRKKNHPKLRLSISRQYQKSLFGFAIVLRTIPFNISIRDILFNFLFHTFVRKFYVIWQQFPFKSYSILLIASANQRGLHALIVSFWFWYIPLTTLEYFSSYFEHQVILLTSLFLLVPNISETNFVLLLSVSVFSLWTSRWLQKFNQ